MILNRALLAARHRFALCLMGLLLTALTLPGQTSAPTLSALNPSSAVVGTPGLILVVTGANFRSGSFVAWNTLPLATTYVNTGQLTATIPAGLLASPGSAVIAVINPGGTQSLNALPFTITGSLVVIATDAMPQGAVGVPYSTTLRATGGTAPYTWASAGALPAGLNLSPSGVIAGTPTTAGTFSFSVQATDANNQNASKTLSITIGAPPFSITTNSPLATGTAGQSYNQVLTASGGTPPYRWALGPGFPAGLRLDPATGALSGTPATAGTFTFPVQVTDATQASATRSFTLTINAPPLNITTVAPLFSGTVGVAYAQIFSASGGVPPYRWTILSGDTGDLTLDAASGTLQGTPRTAGTWSFVIQAADTAAAVVSRSFSLTVNPPSLTISTGSTLAAGQQGVSYSQTFSVAGGTPPYTWSMASGGAPGLTLDPIGVLSGVPTAAGTFNISLAVRDAANIAASRNFTLTIAAATLKITSEAQLPDATLSDPFSYRMVAAGGAAPYTWSANGLPDGLSVDAATGLISGSPAAAGTYAFTVRVTDSTRATAVDLFRITVNLPPTPSASISGLPQTAQPAQQFPLRISLDSTFPAAISGQAILSFAPDSGGGDNTIQFSSGGRTANFTVPADSREVVSATPIAIQTGTVAGTITVSLRLQAGGLDITPTPAPSARIRIERTAPTIQSARVVRSGNGLSIEITGFSTAREVTQLSVTFSAASGQTLQSSTVTVPVEDLFNKWFQDASSSQYGSQFFFSQPFTIQGDASAVTARSVTLSNRVGPTTADIQP